MHNYISQLKRDVILLITIPAFFINLSLDLSCIQSTAHRTLALEAATKSFVLLKNKNNLLPLKDLSKKIAVSNCWINDVML